MPNPAPQKSIPHLGIRLACWFVIYIGAQLPLIVFVSRGNWTESIWDFPLGLEFPAALYVAHWIPESSPLGQTAFRYAQLIVPYAIYIGHLALTLYVRKRRLFLILLWILGAIALFNLACCEELLHSDLQ